MPNYIVQNNIKVNTNVLGADLKREMEAQGLNYAYEATDEKTGRMIADEPVLLERLEKAVLLTWWAEFGPEEAEQFTELQEKHISKLPHPKQIGVIYAAKKMGFGELRPGDTAEIDGKYLEQLLKSSVVAKLKIYDAETNELVWEPTTVDYEYTDYLTPKQKMENRPTTFKGKRIGNNLHPEKAREIYYTPKKPTSKQEKTIDLDQIKEQINQA